MSYFPTIAPGEDPLQALDQQTAVKKLYEKEMREFEHIAKGSAGAGAALMFFALVLSNTMLDYQGAEMNVESGLMNTVSVLNTDLSKINGDINNIFQDIENKNTGQETTDIQDFEKDTGQYYTDLNFYFNTGGSYKEGGNNEVIRQAQAPFKNENFVNAIDGDFNTFQVTDGSITESLFAAIANPNTNWSNIDSSLTTFFNNAYSSSTGSSSGSTSMKQIDDVVSNAETQQNQINSTASTNLSADQQNFNSYEGTMKNILSMITSFISYANNKTVTQ
ncbi:MAG: hypothetical protein KDK59_06450 [Simkania sp.]|nr:hypothetical protein [Simkania sp.]